MKEFILVVDDNHTNLIMAQEILGEKYKVATVNSGEMVEKCLSKISPDLILLDINMPGMNGFDVMKMIKNHHEWKRIPVIFLTADVSPASEVKCFELGASDYIRKPLEPKIMLSRIEKTLELMEYRKNLEEAVKEQAGRITKETEKIVQMQQKVMRIQQEVIESMANLIENRDDSTGEHVKRTGAYVRLIAEGLIERNIYTDILTEGYVDNLCKAAPMHDIGKITVPDSILKKPAKLTNEEFEKIKVHAANGKEIIRRVMGNIEKEDYIEVAGLVAKYHHEKWDGTGYPEGLAGTDIPLCARIMAIADVFDALVSDRCYKKAIPVEEAFNIIEESRGTHFEGILVDVFLEMKEEVKRILR